MFFDRGVTLYRVVFMTDGELILRYDPIDGWWFFDGDRWGIHKEGKILNTRTEAVSALVHGEIEWEDN
jgi:hypothetical protein